MQQIGPYYFPDADTHFAEFDATVGIVNYQKKQRDYALSLVKDFRTALDAGAHVGIFSAHFAELFDEVLAFEPVPEVRACLELNVPSNVRVRPQALSDIGGNLWVNNPTPENTGNAYIDHACNGGTLVDVIRIDDLGLSNLGLLKIDVQGEDYRVLVGARKTIKRCKTVVMIEEKPIGGPGGSIEHVVKIEAFMRGNGATRREKVGADRVYTFD